MKQINRNYWRDKCHDAAKKWWHDAQGVRLERNRGELLMLVVTELAEAVEGMRKGLMDDKLPHRKMEEVEVADAYIRIMDLAGGFDIDFKDPDMFRNNPFPWKGNKSEYLLEICGSLAPAVDEGYDGSVALCDAVLDIETYCEINGLDLFGAIKEKLAFNATRADHTYEARAAAGGKKF